MPLRADEKRKLLGRVPLFSACSGRELRAIGAVADELDVGEGRELIREGKPGREFFVLVEGAADVRRRGRRVNTMRGGDFFGEISLLSRRPTTASVTTTTQARVLVVTDRAFRRVLREVPSVQGKLLQALAERVPDWN